jgi:hypothetical protein
MNIIPIILVLVVLLSVAFSVTYIGLSAGSSDTRNELQKQVGILTAVNSVTVIVLGFLMYYYILGNPSSFIQFTVIMLTFVLFMSIMAVSISVLQQMNGPTA